VEGLNPASFIHETDAAFSGTVVSVKSAPWNLLRGWDGEAEFIYRIKVDRKAKGEFSEIVDVRTAKEQLSCGIGLEPGDKRAFFLSRRDITGAHKWNTNACAVMPADALDGIQPVPGPDVGDGTTLRTFVEQFRIAEALVALNLEVLLWSVVRTVRDRRAGPRKSSAST